MSDGNLARLFKECESEIRRREDLFGRNKQTEAVLRVMEENKAGERAVNLIVGLEPTYHIDLTTLHDVPDPIHPTKLMLVLEEAARLVEARGINYNNRQNDSEIIKAINDACKEIGGLERNLI